MLVGIVILGSVVAALAGITALSDTRKSVEVARAESAMAELDAGVSDTALGADGISARNVEFGGTGPDGYLETTHESWLRVDVIDSSTGVNGETITNVTLGTVTYRHGETTVAYEGGGVWRGDGSTTTLVSPPEFHYRNKTLTLPIIDISSDSDGQLSERISIQRRGEMDRRFPNETAGLTNRIDDGRVTVTVHSDYYLAWGRYFEETTGTYVAYDHDKETVTVIFLSTPTTVSFSDGIIATSGTGEFALAGNGAYTDSYDSSVGPYNVSQGENGDVFAAGNVTMVGDSEVLGDVNSGATVNLTGSAIVHHDVNWTDEYIETEAATVYGTISRHDGDLTVLPPVFANSWSKAIRERTSSKSSLV